MLHDAPHNVLTFLAENCGVILLVTGLLAALGVFIWRRAILRWFEARAEKFAERFMQWRTDQKSGGWPFRLRIWVRVQWLFFKRWWHENISLWSLSKAFVRPTLLIIIGLGVPVTASFYLPSLNSLIVAEAPCFPDANTPANTPATNAPAAPNAIATPPDPKPCTAKALQTDEKKFGLPAIINWRAAIQFLLLFVAAPAAFVLWAFRDHNARANLDNQRKDINLKEFQEIQMRAAGALDEKLPKKARQTMQIAAIHQLRPFLRGEYGASFRRPAWELLKARLAISAEESGYSAIRQWVEQGKFPVDEDETPKGHAQRIRAEIRRNINAISPDPVTLAERALITEEKGRIFRTDLPVREARFGGMGLSGALLSKLDLYSASFIGADLRNAHLEGADLEGAHLESAKLWFAHLEGAHLIDAHLEGANLSGAHLEGADLWAAHLEGADLSGAHLEGAHLIDAHLEGANLAGAWFDDDTALTSGWQGLSPDQKATRQKKLRDLGARHVNDPPKDDGE